MAKGEFNIVIEGLAVGYKLPRKRHLILHEQISFSAEHGEMVALIGRNGIGKSTLLRTLAGFQPFFSGQIYLNNKSLNDYPASELSKLVSFVSTENIRIPNMSVFDLVAYGRFPYTGWIGKLEESDRQIVADSIRKVGLEGFENRLVQNISDGERQRVMIARAVAQDTPVIILDEPTAFLDISNKYEIFHLLQVLAQTENKTIVLSTHDLSIALHEVDKFWIMAKENVFEGAPEDAVLNGWLSQLFENSHIEFEPETGDYFFKKEFREKVRIEGSGLPLNWTFRAFNRLGFQIVTSATPDFTVRVESRGGSVFWNLQKTGVDRTFTSLYELLKVLR